MKKQPDSKHASQHASKHYIPVVPSPNSYRPSGQCPQTFQVGCKAHLPRTPSRTPPVRTRLPSLLPIGRFATVRFTAQNPKTARRPFRRGYASGTTRKRPHGPATALQRDRFPSGNSYSGHTPRHTNLKHHGDYRGTELPVRPRVSFPRYSSPSPCESRRYRVLPRGRRCNMSHRQEGIVSERSSRSISGART